VAIPIFVLVSKSLAELGEAILSTLLPLPQSPWQQSRWVS